MAKEKSKDLTFYQLSEELKKVSEKLEKLNSPDTEFPLLYSLARSARKIDISVTWSFDEQQADPVHKNYSGEMLIEELNELFELIGNAASEEE